MQDCTVSYGFLRLYRSDALVQCPEALCSGRQSCYANGRKWTSNRLHGKRHFHRYCLPRSCRLSNPSGQHRSARAFGDALIGELQPVQTDRAHTRRPHSRDRDDSLTPSVSAAIYACSRKKVKPSSSTNRHRADPIDLRPLHITSPRRPHRTRSIRLQPSDVCTRIFP